MYACMHACMVTEEREEEGDWKVKRMDYGTESGKGRKVNKGPKGCC